MFESDGSHTDHVRDESSLGAERAEPRPWTNRRIWRFERLHSFSLPHLNWCPEASKHRGLSIHLKSQCYLESPVVNSVQLHVGEESNGDSDGHFLLRKSVTHITPVLFWELLWLNLFKNWYRFFFFFFCNRFFPKYTIKQWRWDASWTGCLVWFSHHKMLCWEGKEMSWLKNCTHTKVVGFVRFKKTNNGKSERDIFESKSHESKSKSSWSENTLVTQITVFFVLRICLFLTVQTELSNMKTSPQKNYGFLNYVLLILNDLWTDENRTDRGIIWCACSN